MRPGPAMSMVSVIRKGNLESHIIIPKAPKDQLSCDSLWIYVLTSYWDFYFVLKNSHSIRIRGLQ